MLRKIPVVCALVVALVFMASCGLGNTGCDVQTKTQSGSGGSVGGRTTPSVCGTATNAFTPNGPTCSSNGSHTSFLYVGDRLTGNIDTFGLNSDGTLEFMCHSAQMDADVTTLANSANKFLFAYSSSNARLFGWTLNGPKLTPVPNTPDPVGTIGGGLDDRLFADPLGHFLFLGNSNSAGITVMNVDTLGGTAGSPFPDGSTAAKMATHPTGKFLYSFHGTVITEFAVSTSGVLTPLALPSVAYLAQGGPVEMIKVDPTGKFLYVLATGSISFYRIDQTTGQLTFASDVAPAALQANSAPSDFTFDANGKYLYVANPGSLLGAMGWVDAFAIDSTTGALTAIPGEPFLTNEGTPYHVVADPDGQHLWVVVGSSGGPSRIFGMTIGTGGVLTPPATSPTGFTFGGNSPAALAKLPTT